MKVLLHAGQPGENAVTVIYRAPAQNSEMVLLLAPFAIKRVAINC